MKKVLVTGANGLLGQHLINTLLKNEYTVIGIGKNSCRLPFAKHAHFIYYDCDITDEMAVYNVFEKEQPAVVVHAAAMTQVDDCELQQEKAEAVNVKGTATVLLNAEAHSSHFIYISTDFVFDGEKGNYAEDDHLNPISWYGFTKVQAESITELSEIPWTIVRTCLVYGNTLSGTRSNIVTWVKQNLEAHQSIKVVTDQVRTPTYVADLAKGIILIIEKNVTGVFHVSGKDVLTPFQMAEAVASYFKLDRNLLQPVDASTFTQPGKRPLKTGFNINKAVTQLGYQPLSFEEGIAKMFEAN
jgi:dTDP-4-dehydrorhamnose reductase